MNRAQALGVMWERTSVLKPTMEAWGFIPNTCPSDFEKVCALVAREYLCSIYNIA
jgi:hypothetical protein